MRNHRRGSACVSDSRGRVAVCGWKEGAGGPCRRSGQDSLQPGPASTVDHVTSGTREPPGGFKQRIDLISYLQSKCSPGRNFLQSCSRWLNGNKDSEEASGFALRFDVRLGRGARMTHDFLSCAF